MTTHLVRNSSVIRKVSQNELLADPGIVELTEDCTLPLFEEMAHQYY